MVQESGDQPSMEVWSEEKNKNLIFEFSSAAGGAALALSLFCPLSSLLPLLYLILR